MHLNKLGDTGFGINSQNGTQFTILRVFLFNNRGMEKEMSSRGNAFSFSSFGFCAVCVQYEIQYVSGCTTDQLCAA